MTASENRCGGAEHTGDHDSGARQGADLLGGEDSLAEVVGGRRALDYRAAVQVVLPLVWQLRRLLSAIPSQGKRKGRTQ